MKMGIHEVYPTLLKLTSNVEEAGASLEALNQAVADEPDRFRERIFLAYAEGYKAWLLAGLGPLSGAQMIEIAEYAPDIISGFLKKIETVREPFNAEKLRNELRGLNK
jgi:hypothetical protein